LVRAAVFLGIANLVHNPLALPALKILLPSMSKLIHDKATRVRMCFLDLLLAVKSTKHIRFWDVVKIDELLLRYYSV